MITHYFTYEARDQYLDFIHQHLAWHQIFMNEENIPGKQHFPTPGTSEWKDFLQKSKYLLSSDEWEDYWGGANKHTRAVVVNTYFAQIEIDLQRNISLPEVDTAYNRMKESHQHLITLMEQNPTTNPSELYSAFKHEYQRIWQCVNAFPILEEKPFVLSVNRDKIMRVGPWTTSGFIYLNRLNLNLGLWPGRELYVIPKSCYLYMDIIKHPKTTFKRP